MKRLQQLLWSLGEMRPNIARYALVARVFSAVLLLGVWATMATLLRWEWQSTLEAQKQQTTNIAIALKEHTLRSLETVAYAMRQMEAIVQERDLTPMDYVRIARETGMVPHILSQLSFVNARGDFQGSNLDPTGQIGRKINLLDREHIRVHLQPSASPVAMLQDGLFIGSVVVGKVSGQRTVQLSRKVQNAAGRTIGVVVASLNAAYFSGVYQEVSLGPEGGVGLVGLDGGLRVRVLGGTDQQATSPVAGELLQALTDGRDGAIISHGSDGVERINGYSRVGDYPLFVLSGMTTEQAFSNWRTARNMVLVLAALFGIAVLAFVQVFLGSIERLAWSHAELTRSEAQAQQANHAKSAFLAAMSHELRTPLTSILGFAELMSKRSQDAMVREQSAIIRDAAQRLHHLLTEIWDWVSLESGSMSVHLDNVGLRELLDGVVASAAPSAATKSLALSVKVDPATPMTLVTDPEKLQKILQNLLSNAVKFTTQGSVTLTVEPSLLEGEIWFHITDTGPGIDPALHEAIFECFRQGDARVSYEHGGTGLGLSVSRALAHLLGGVLSVSSRPGAGSCFTLALPVHLSPVSPPSS